MARRILNRKDLRADYDAAERRKQEEEDRDELEEEEEDLEEEEVAEHEEDEGEEEDEDEEEEAAPRKRKPAKAKTTPAKPRSRAGKVTRQKVVWGVFNNSNQRVASFDYPKRKEAEELAAKLTLDKKNTHFVQPVREPLEEKK